jgi:hypothetical protein
MLFTNIKIKSLIFVNIPMSNMRKLFLIAFIFHHFLLCAQEGIKTHSAFYSTLVSHIPKQANQHYQFHSPISSLSIQIADNQVINPIYLITKEDTFILTKDIHSEMNNTDLVIFPKAIQEFSIYSPQNLGKVVFHLLYAPILPIKDSLTNIYKIEEDCSLPEIIAGSQWREGLTPPKEAPSATTVRHVIIHHAAGSNTNTNYREVVRNIYLLHTQVNGWNDIGYNFLVAQNGQVFEGRIGRGNLTNDNVLGAHFCGKNGNTMGICLLGNYQTANPSEPMLNSLYKVIAWKLRKENMFNPFASSLHPIGNTEATMLGVISGHRDGCATDCPGDNVYRLLSQIKMNVVRACNVLESSDRQIDKNIFIYPQPATDELIFKATIPIKSIELYDLTGKKYEQIAMDLPSELVRISLLAYPKGIYLLKITQNEHISIRKVLIN